MFCLAAKCVPVVLDDVSTKIKSSSRRLKKFRGVFIYDSLTPEAASKKGFLSVIKESNIIVIIAAKTQTSALKVRQFIRDFKIEFVPGDR